ncbi:MAG: helix-turn-helix domain-containing protein [Ruminococcaceae bacterium]|nr:helix-turn-helix domain-containing protein [Oscillospiraceae bacterium]
MIITDKELLSKYCSSHRVWQGVPAIVHTKGGKTFVSFYSGNTKETFGNYCVIVAAHGNSEFGEPIAVIEKIGRARCFDPVLWLDPLDRLWVIWNVMPGDEVWGAIAENPDADSLEFGEEFYIGRGIMMNKPTVISSGEWLFPIYLLPNEFFRELRDPGVKEDEPSAAFAYKTSDNGKTFIKLGGAEFNERSFDEHMILEEKSGVFALYARTKYGIGISYSYDRGKRWSRGKNSGLGGPDSRFFISRLKSGRVLLINHYQYTARDKLCAMLSEDDGKTFPYKLMLDERYVSYPDAHEADDGFIYIAYDRERGGFSSSLNAVYKHAREILVAKITEDDIISGKIMNKESRLNAIASKLTTLAEGDPDPYQEEAMSDSELARTLIEREKSDIISAVFEKYPMNCVNNTPRNTKKIDSLIKRFTDSEEKNLKLIEKIIHEVREQPGNRSHIYPIVEKARDYLTENLEKDESIFEISEKLTVSVYYLCHLFKNVTGTTLIEYRNEARLAKSKAMLINTELSVSEISLSVGFASPSYFSETFLKNENLSPTEYRKLHKKI